MAGQRMRKEKYLNVWQQLTRTMHVPNQRQQLEVSEQKNLKI